MAKESIGVEETRSSSLLSPENIGGQPVNAGEVIADSEPRETESRIAQNYNDAEAANFIDVEVFPESCAKPKGMYLLWDGVYKNLYGAPERAKILSQVQIVHDLVTPDIYENSLDRWPGVEMLFSGWGIPKCDADFLQRFPDLKIVFYGAGSIRAFVTDEFWKRGIRVTTAACANAVPVAEFTLSQVLFALKQGWQMALGNRQEKKGKPFRFAPAGAYGGVVGLISLGMVGRLVLERLRTFDVRVIAYDPFVDTGTAKRLGVTMVGLDELFAQADVVSCHAPHLPETEKMIGGRHFAAMKYGSTFINTARGAVVHEAQMCQILEGRPDLMAVLDVTETEPPAADSPLHRLGNVVLTPHIAGSVGPECQRMGAVMAEELARYIAGQPLLYEIDPSRASMLA